MVFHYFKGNVKFLRKICYGQLGLSYCKILEYVCALSRISFLLDKVNWHHLQKVWTTTPCWLRQIIYNTLGAAHRLTVSPSNWMDEISCEVLALPLPLENPNKDVGSYFGVEKEVFTYILSSRNFLCVCSTYHNLSLSFYNRRKKPPQHQTDRIHWKDRVSILNFSISVV